MTTVPYTLEQAQAAVRDALNRSKDRHELWRVLELLYRTGDIAAAKAAAPATGTLDVVGGLSNEVVNLVLPHTTVMVASVTANDPRMVMEPLAGGEDTETAAVVAENIVHHFWRKAFATQDLADATQDAVHLGNGFLKVGWDFDAEERERAADEVEAELAALLDADRRLVELGADPTPVEELRAQVASTTSVTRADEPYVEYVPPYDIFVPPNARRMWETRWVAQRVTLPLEEVEGNPEFAGGVDVRPDGPTHGKGATDYRAAWARKAAEAAVGVETGQTATLFEFYDMRAHRMMVFQLDASAPLYDGEIPWSHRYPPFVHVVGYRENGTEFWGFGDLENVAHIQGMLNEFLTEQIDNARRSGQKYLINEDAASDELTDALESDQSDVVAYIRTNGLPLSEVIQPVVRQALSGDVYAVKAEMEEYLRKVLGVNDFQAGGVGADRMSATAAAVVDGVATLRATSKVKSVEDAAAQVGRLILLLCQEFLDEPRAIRVAGVRGAAWPKVDRDDIRGEFHVTVEGGSTQAMNPATREQRGLRSLTQIVPAVADLGFDPVPLVRSALRDLGYDPDVVLATPEPAPAPEPPPAAAGGVPEGAPAAPMAELGGPPTAALAQAMGDLAI